MRKVRLPPSFVASAREFREGAREPATPRDAATVLLLRGGGAAQGPEVFLLRRRTSMAFAGGMYVFPGGGVDRRDFDSHVRWAGPAPEEWADLLGADTDTARALVCAAVRETFEESGVLLAGEADDQVVSDTTGEDWERDRAALEGKELAFTDFLEQRGLVLRTDLLAPFRAWLTPAFEPRRYRTWFFAAALPEGQRTRDVSHESDEVVWLPAMRAVEEVEAERVAMLPPTYQSCLEVAQHAGPDAVLAAGAGRRLEMFLPELLPEDPDDPEAGGTMTSPSWMQELLEQRP